MWFCMIVDCLFNGRVISDGRRFQAPGDRCQQCTCEQGNVRCQSSGPCPTLSCRITEQLPGECCPRCKGTQTEPSDLHTFYGKSFINLSLFSQYWTDKCICSLFLVGCLQGGQRYQNGDTISASLCESCVCNQGLCEMSCHVYLYIHLYIWIRSANRAHAWLFSSLVMLQMWRCSPPNMSDN